MVDTVGDTAETVEETVEETTAVIDVTEAATVTETDSAALREEILAAAESIWTQIKSYAGSDYATDFQTAQRDKTCYAYHGYAEPYAFVAVSDYIVSGTHPNTNLSYDNPSELILKKQDREWKLCYV